jgi:hypothetical protein
MYTWILPNHVLVGPCIDTIVPTFVKKAQECLFAEMVDVLVFPAVVPCFKPVCILRFGIMTPWYRNVNKPCIKVFYKRNIWKVFKAIKKADNVDCTDVRYGDFFNAGWRWKV